MPNFPLTLFGFHHGWSLQPVLTAARRIIYAFADSVMSAYDNESSLEKRFNDIVRTHDELIIRLCFGYAHSRSELDELHQDTLVNIWNGLHRFRGDSSVRTWIYRITLNTCVSTLRNRYNSDNTVQLSELYDTIDETDDRKVFIGELHDCINRLTPVDKAIVLLWLDEFSYDEISSLVGLPRNTVATRLRRAKEKLKKLYSI